LSMGGCYVETSAMLLPGSKLKLTFSVDQTTVVVHSVVIRMDMGIGGALKFDESTHEVRTALQHVLDHLAAAENKHDRQRGQNAAAGL